ncbi:MAG: SLC13/DASS family transporter [Thiotrichaceae bacterium]|nr:SLC13/DASS family transporter [Thiotrichaceae bacterium]
MIKRVRQIALLLGPTLGLSISAFVDIPGHPHAASMLGVVVWMAIWWLSECVPLAITALLPLITFPLMGIATAKETAPRYMGSIMFLFIGGFLIAQAMERTGLHQRIALVILSHLHGSPFQILVGFALSTAFLSMWISNTATTMLMATIAIAVLTRLDKVFDGKTMVVMASTLLLTIAYSANIGGMGTPVGTVPNLVFLENMSAAAPDDVPSFLEWMMVGVPMVVVGITIVVFYLGRRVRNLSWSNAAVEGISDELQSLGTMRRDERFVAWVLGLTAVAWMTRKGIQGEGFDIPGWASLLPYEGVDDGTVAIVAALLLFLVPIREGKPIMDKSTIGRLPWDIILLLGGGFALAMGMKNSGLSFWVGDQLQFLSAVPLPLMLLGIALVIVFLTEVTSNTATTQVMLPVLAAIAIASDHDVTQLLLTATLAASCAFMLPVATPPNAIIFGTERVTMSEMIKAGFRLNLVFPLVILAAVLALRPLMP